MAKPNTDPLIRSVVTEASCPGCGTTVSERGKVCEMCAMKPQFQPPPATVALGRQPEPPYHTQGNFRRLPGANTDEGAE
jgi:hypothetical protein